MKPLKKTSLLSASQTSKLFSLSSENSPKTENFNSQVQFDKTQEHTKILKRAPFDNFFFKIRLRIYFLNFWDYFWNEPFFRTALSLSLFENVLSNQIKSIRTAFLLELWLYYHIQFEWNQKGHFLIVNTSDFLLTSHHIDGYNQRKSRTVQHWV